MGRNSNYFRHTFDAHNDVKIQNLIDRGGLKAVGAYYILLEIYGRSIAENDVDLNNSCVVELHIRRIATAFRLRTDSTRTVIELIADCKLIESVRFKLDSSSVEVAIPNFVKYFGSYKKTEHTKIPIKENKIKENKIKINTIKKSSNEDFKTGQTSTEIMHSAKKKETLSDENKTLARSIRENYISGYQNRYGVKPTWAAKENSLVKILISRVGQEALELSANYLNYNDPWHIQQKHPFGLLVSQLDKIRVELNNPNRMLDHHQAKKQLQKHTDKFQENIDRQNAFKDFLNTPEEIEND